MLPAENRMLTKYEFNLTRFLANKLQNDPEAQAGKIFTKNFTIFYLKPLNYEGAVRVGIAVSTKTHKSAVKRNRIKRRVREIIRLNLDKMVPSHWIVIHPKASILDLTYEEISFELIKTLQKYDLSR